MSIEFARLDINCDKSNAMTMTPMRHRHPIRIYLFYIQFSEQFVSLKSCLTSRDSFLGLIDDYLKAVK